MPDVSDHLEPTRAQDPDNRPVNLALASLKRESDLRLLNADECQHVRELHKILTSNVYDSAVEYSSTVSPFNAQVTKLLADYFTRRIPKKEQALLASQLVFPESASGAELFRKSLERSLSEKRTIELKGIALYPLSPRGATLYADRHLRPSKMTTEDRIELLAIDHCLEYPASVGDVQRRITSFSAWVRDSETPREAAKAEVVEFVRISLQSTIRPPTVEDLSVVFGMPTQEIESLLRDSTCGLNKDEQLAFEEAQVAAKARNTFAITNHIVRAMRHLVFLENEMHQSGAIQHLSTAPELAQLFGVSTKEMNSLLRFLPYADTQYRVHILENKSLSRQRQHLVDFVESEIDGFSSGDLERVHTDEEIAARLGLEAITVHTVLERKLSTHYLRTRDIALRKHGSLPEFRTSPVAYVNAELAAFRKGEIDRLKSEAELAALFYRSPEEVFNQLRSGDQRLNAEDRRFRQLVLALQSPQDPASRAMRQVRSTYLRERIEHHAVKAGQPVVTREQEQSTSRNDKRSKIHFRGLEFDSLEETACAILFEKYVPRYQLRQGESFQVEANGRYVDFVMGNVVIEYHPILLFMGKNGLGSFKSFADYEHFKKIRDSLRHNKHQRRMFIAETRELLAFEYRREREEVINASPKLRGKELVVAQSADEFYYQVIKRFSPNPPSREKFIREFNKTKARVKRANPELYGRHSASSKKAA